MDPELVSALRVVVSRREDGELWDRNAAPDDPYCSEELEPAVETIARHVELKERPHEG